MSERKEGYYWIRFSKDSEWTIAKWLNKPLPCWYFCFTSFEYSSSKDKTPYEIDPTPITRNGE